MDWQWILPQERKMQLAGSIGPRGNQHKRRKGNISLRDDGEYYEVGMRRELARDRSRQPAGWLELRT
jgi:hypothetical protein